MAIFSIKNVMRCIRFSNSLDMELGKIRSTLITDSYPEDIFSDCFRKMTARCTKKIGRCTADKKYGPQNHPVHLKMPWLGNFSMRLEDRTKNTIPQSFASANPRLVFSTQEIGKFYHPFKRIAYLPHKKFRCLLNFCRCHAGHNSLILLDSIKHQRQRNKPTIRSNNTSLSQILLQINTGSP